MTEEVPGIRPAVISTETGTRLDEYRRFRHVVRNVYTHRFDPAKLGKWYLYACEWRISPESFRGIPVDQKSLSPGENHISNPKEPGGGIN